MDLPLGLETFSTGRTFVSCGTASKELHRKFFTGGEINGPAAKPDFTQVATQSVTSLPYVVAEGQLPSSKDGSCSFWYVGAPYVRFSITVNALMYWSTVHFLQLITKS